MRMIEAAEVEGWNSEIKLAFHLLYWDCPSLHHPCQTTPNNDQVTTDARNRDVKVSIMEQRIRAAGRSCLWVRFDPTGTLPRSLQRGK
jgi:hypothetical protein